jgi:hypothetical protein
VAIDAEELRLQVVEQDVKDLIKAKSNFRGYEEEIRTMQRGMAVTAFGEPTKVQAIKGFSWSQERASTLLAENESKALKTQQLKLTP